MMGNQRSACTVLFALLLAARSLALPSTKHKYSASSYVGLSTSAIFPTPNATNAATEYDSYFPHLSVVGNAGPTPSKFPF